MFVVTIQQHTGSLRTGDRWK